MSKEQMIEAIRKKNKSVSNEYLVSFDEKVLQTYLNRLTDLAGKRGRSSVWMRPENSFAVTSRNTSMH